MPTPKETSSGVTLSSVRDELQGLTGLIVTLGTMKKTAAGEHSDIAANLMVDTYGAINTARNHIGALAVALGKELPDLGGNGSGDPDPDPVIPTEGAEPINPDSVQRLEDSIVTATINGDTTAWNVFDTSEYFPDLGNMFSAFFNIGDTLQIELENVTPGFYDLFATFGGSAGGAIFDAAFNGGAASEFSTIRGVDTQVLGAALLGGQEFTEDPALLVLTCTHPGQLNMALVTIKA